MLRRVIGEKTAPLLFTMDIELDPCDRSVLDQGVQTMSVNKDGTVKSNKAVAGRIPECLWAYMQHFDAPAFITRKGYNLFTASICGEADRSLIVPEADKRPYIYGCGSVTPLPFMLPHEEYLCDLEDKDDHFDVFVGGNKVGEYYDKKNRGKLDTIRKYLSYGWRTTAQLELDTKYGVLYVIIVKV